MTLPIPSAGVSAIPHSQGEVPPLAGTASGVAVAWWPWGLWDTQEGREEGLAGLGFYTLCSLHETWIK